MAKVHENNPASNSMLLAVEKSVNILSTALSVVSGVAFIALILLVSLDVGSRTLTSSSFPGTLEVVSIVLMPLIVFGGYALAHRRDQHIRMTLLYSALSKVAGLYNRIAVELVSMVGATILVIYSWKKMMTSVSIRESKIGIVEIPVWPSTIFMFAGICALLAYSALLIVKDLKKISSITEERA